MPTIDINNKVISKAKADARPGCERQEITDSRAKGLRIRIGPRGAVWQYRYERVGKGSRLDLGAIDEWAIAEAREIAAEAAVAVRADIALDADWMRQQRIKRGKLTEDLAPVQEVLTWDWDEAVAHFLGEVQRTLKPRTHQDYAGMLRTPELVRFHWRAVSTITLKEMTLCIGDVHRRGVERHAEHLASVVRPMWRFLAHLDCQDASGVTDRRLMAELEAPARSRSTARRKTAKYSPPIHEAGRMLVIARSGAFHPIVGAALELILFTAQRVTALATAHKSDFTATGVGTAGLWSMPPSRRKTAETRGDEADHIVPLPEPAWAAVHKMLELTDDDDPNPHLFRGIRPRRAGDEIMSIAPSNLQHAMMYSPGISMRPHDVRRAFTAVGSERWDWTLPMVKTVLDHNEGRSSNDVTVLNYLWRQTGPKWDMMRAWCSAVEEAAAEELGRDPRLADLDWLKSHVTARRDEHKTGKRKGVTLAKSPKVSGTSPLTSP